MAVPVSRSYVFTWNNYPADAYDLLTVLRPRCHLMAVGKEVAASGTAHLQGFLIMKSPCRMGSLIRQFPGVHFEVKVTNSSEKQCVDYTKKEGNPDRLDWDDRQQGSRTDLAAVCDVIKTNPRIAVRAVAAQFPTTFVKYHAGISALTRALQPVGALHTQRHVCWFFGDTGCGKSYTAVEEALAAAGGDASDVYRWTITSLKWAGSYSGQRYVIIDELRPDWDGFSMAALFGLLDQYAHEVEIKGSQVSWAATHIWITTPLTPQDFFSQYNAVKKFREESQQLIRRLHDIRAFTIPYVAPAPSAWTPPAVCPDSEPDQPPPSVTPPLARGFPRFAFADMQYDSDTDSEGRAAGLLRARLDRLPVHLRDSPDCLEVA